MSDRGIPDDVRYDGYREFYGRKVRQLWIEYCKETGDDKPSHLAPWEELSEWDREADRRIGTGIVEWNGDDEWVPVPRAEHDALMAQVERTVNEPSVSVDAELTFLERAFDAYRAALGTEATDG